MDQRHKHGSNRSDLNCTQPHKIDDQLYESASLRDALAKTSQHSLFEGRIGFFMSESFFKDFVHGFGFLMSFSADGAIDEVRMKGAAFLLGKFAVTETRC